MGTGTTMNCALLLVCLLLITAAAAVEQETLPPLEKGQAPQTFEALWAGFDPRAEPLETETLREWEEEGVVLRVLRYRLGVFKGKKAMMAAVYGFPKGGTKLPGLVQIHGGGQYADYRAPLYNAKRGYATISLSWAGRISAPDYHVSPLEVRLFWDGKTDDSRYRLTTDWGALDAYHAPCRNPKNGFHLVTPHPWTLDEVESPRNNPWFLCTLGARRALTFLERQPEVDADRLGVYGHSMGGKLTVMTAGADSRVKAAAPSCGGVSDRNNSSALYRATIGDEVYLKHITCPIIFLNPANDFHARLNDLQQALDEIKSTDWRVTCSAHHNHQDTEPYQVAGPLWFDQQFKGTFTFPQTPQAKLALKTPTGVPTLTVRPDTTREIVSVDVFYTQQGEPAEGQDDRLNAIHRFWHYAQPRRQGDAWVASLRLATTKRSLWAYANVRYPLAEPVTGAGYYYGPYTAKTFNLSSRLQVASAADLVAADVKPALKPSPIIETFERNWQKEWFTYDLTGNWARRTHKVYDDLWKAPPFAKLALDVRSQQPNKLVVGLDEFAAEVQLTGGSEWQQVVLFPLDFSNAVGGSFLNWAGIMELRLGPAETLRPPRGVDAKSRNLGGEWQGPPPEFRNLRWVEGTREELNARRSVKLPVGDQPGARIYLRDEYADAFTSFHAPRIDTDPNGNPLTLDGKTYEHGITVHAPSEGVFFLGGKFAKFHALAAAGRIATVTFQVFVDGKQVFDSGLLTRSASKPIDLPLTGAQELRLLVTDGGNDKGGDWAHWLEAWVEAGPR